MSQGRGEDNIPLVAADALQWSRNDYLEAGATHTPIMLRLDAGRQVVIYTSEVISIANARGVGCEIHVFGPGSGWNATGRIWMLIRNGLGGCIDRTYSSRS